MQVHFAWSIRYSKTVVCALDYEFLEHSIDRVFDLYYMLYHLGRCKSLALFPPTLVKNLLRFNIEDIAESIHIS